MINSQKAHRHRKGKHGLNRKMRPKKRQSKKGIKCKEYEPKSPHILHATKDKHQPVRAVESNKHEGSNNGVKAKKKHNSDKVKHTQRSKAPPTCT